MLASSVKHILLFGLKNIEQGIIFLKRLLKEPLPEATGLSFERDDPLGHLAGPSVTSDKFRGEGGCSAD